MTSSSLQGKRVLITGSASGIGYETALAFAKEGCSIIATDIQEAALEGLKKELESLSAECVTHVLNVTDLAAWTTLAASLAAEDKTPDILINNAGIAYIASFLETDPDMLSRTLDINIKGVFYGCQAFIPSMKSSNRASNIVNVASLASKTPVPNMAAYAASKFAVEGLTDAIAMELHDTKINLHCCHPGVINTPILHNRAMIGASISDAQLNRLQNHYVTEGCHPSVVANDIVSAIKKNQMVILSGPRSRFGGVIARLLSKRLKCRLTVKMAPEIGYL